MSAYNFVYSGQNFTNFFGSTTKGSFSSTPFRFCCYLHRFQRYLRSNSKVVVKRTKFWTFFALPNFKGGGDPQKLHPRCHPHLTARHVAKFNKATPPGSKVLADNTLHFKPTFHQFLKKNVKKAPVPDEGCASKAWSFSSACENLGA